MVVCKFFAQGNCRYGNSCRFEHPQTTSGGNQNRFGALQTTGNRYGSGNEVRKNTPWNINTNDIRNDLTDGKGRPKWILSTYGPGGGAPASLLDGNEFSPEEVRVRFYELASDRKETEADQEAIALWSKAEQTINDVINNVGNVIQFMEEADKKHPNRYDFCKTDGTKTRDQVIQEAKSQNTASGFDAGSAFGQSSSTPNPFSKPPASSFGQPSGPSAFGSSSFGKPAFGQAGFGGTPSPTMTSPFGQPAATNTFSQPAVTSAFGKPPLGNTGFSQTGFGQPAQLSSPFAQPSQPTSSFGQPTFGSPGFGQEASKNPFAAPAASSSGFSQTSSAFGQPAQTSTAFGQPSQPASAFGQPSQPASTFGQQTQPTSVFGQPAQPSSTFGQPSQPSQPSAFGQPSQPTSAFGQPSQPTSTFGQPSQPTATVFGQPPGISSAFGQPAQSGNTSFGQPAASTPFGSTPAPTGIFGKASEGASNPFGAQPNATQANDQTMDGPRPTSTEDPFDRPGSKPSVASPNITARSGSVSAGPVKLNTNNSASPHPLTGRPPKPLHYTQTIPLQPNQTNTSNQLTSYRGQRVQYNNDGVPLYQRPDRRGLEKIWFPNAGADNAVRPLGAESKINDLQGSENQYTDEVKDAYRFLVDEGRFKDGKIPLLPPMWEWSVYDF